MKRVSLIILIVLNFSQVFPQKSERFKKFKNEKFSANLQMLNCVLFGGWDQKGVSFRSGFKGNHLGWKKLDNE